MPFTGLDPRDSGEIVRKLDEQGIPYRLSDQGRTILVPQDQVYKLRIDLAAEGLPSGGVVGLESFKEASFGSTEFDRRVQYAAALQGELTRTLRQLEEVEDARVHLVIPEQSIFLRDRYEPTASVLVKLRPGRTLSEWQIRGIVNLVAYSVEGMKPKNVTVVDTKGTPCLLSWRRTGSSRYPVCRCSPSFSCSSNMSAIWRIGSVVFWSRSSVSVEWWPG